MNRIYDADVVVHVHRERGDIMFRLISIQLHIKHTGKSTSETYLLFLNICDLFMYLTQH